MKINIRSAVMSSIHTCNTSFILMFYITFCRMSIIIMVVFNDDLKNDWVGLGCITTLAYRVK